MKTWAWMMMGLASALALGACGTPAQSRSVTRGDEVAFYDFNAPGGFEEGSYGAATLRVTGGKYRIDVVTGDNTLWWGQWGDTYSDVIIDVDAQQLTERPETTYGVMCRVRGSVGQPRTPDAALLAVLTDTPSELSTPEIDSTVEMTVEATTADATAEASMTAEATADSVEATRETAIADEATAEIIGTTPQTDLDAEATPETTPSMTDVPSYGEGDGYVFLVQGSGAYGIFRARGRNLTPLVNWTVSDKINIAAASNHIRAVCVGDYLALYINDQLMGEATDDTYTQGQVGLVASAATRLGQRVDFDNLSIALPAS